MHEELGEEVIQKNRVGLAKASMQASLKAFFGAMKAPKNLLACLDNALEYCIKFFQNL